MPITENKKISVLLIFPISLIILAFIFDDTSNIVNGLYRIIINPDILLTDYLKVGGLGATFINSAILSLLNIYLIKKLDIKVNGISIAAIFIITGFAFLGKNIYNVWPIYLGGYLYSRYQKSSFKSVALITMFGTAISPLVNEISYGLNLPYPINILAGILVGVLAGFVLPPLSAHLLRAHAGYSLYNIGFTAGFLGTVIASLLRSFGLTIESTLILSNEYDLLMKIYLTSFFILLIIIGFIFNEKSFKNYSDIFEYSGRLITDFTQLTNFGIALINMGIMGLIGMIYVIISRGVVDGPIVGALLTIVGFASFGKHPKNCIPILIGVFLGSLVNIWDGQSTVVIIAGLFGTTLAPIAGEYGWLRGILAGFLHLSVVMNIGVIHGGINLYNNGFSGGLVASFLVPIIDAFKKEDK
ncbi:DUF1576 domain-containing protein [Sporosalibacterium faouarense]|uniref:DUF1576 domain-containing protein n=1 Tax=Sporosalibacterium faouarense TaxID=516123 RepID=UPI00141C413B|nr:DUF1576 domain-containing protein [Sporosalibacterium faouarense]MTI49735.1 DUF1576 domain-containing protein [Bacillota bacterium]